MKVENRVWRSEFARRHIAEGEARGEAKMLLLILDGRGVEVTDEVRERIVSCTDTARLELWAQRALTAETIAEVVD